MNALEKNRKKTLSSGIKKTMIIISLCGLSLFSFGQKAYQSGVYPRQMLRPGSKTIKGLLIDKYSSNGFLWYSIVDHDQVFRISVLKLSDFETAKVNGHIVLKDCFELSSKKWKCTPPKKKSTFMQRNVFFADSQ